MTQEQGTPPGFWERIQQMIDQGVAKAMRSGPLRNASISEGGTFTIKGGQLRVLYPVSLGSGVGVYFGDLYSGATYVGTGFLAQGPDGFDIASFRSDAATGTSIAVIRDAQQNAVFYTDNAAGQGIARPYVPLAFYAARFTDTPAVTTSSTFETLWVANGYKQHAAVYVAAASLADAGIGGEVRVMVNGVQLGTTQTVSTTAAGHAFGPAAVAGAHMVSQAVQIQARVTSGAGALRVMPQTGFGLPV